MITEGNEKRRVIRLEKPDTKRPKSNRNIQDRIEKRQVYLGRPKGAPPFSLIITGIKKYMNHITKH